MADVPDSKPPSTKGGLVAALRFLLPLGGDPAPTAGEVVPNMVRWIVPTGFVIGLAWAGTFRIAWKLFGETVGLRVVPSLIVVLIECLFTGALLAMGLARTSHVLTGRQPLRAEPDSLAPLSPVGTLVLCLTVICQYALILSIPAMQGWWPPPNDWRNTFNFMYPAPIYRPLILAPIWGRWGILLAAALGRSAHKADGMTVALNQAMSPGRLLLHALGPFALTAVYCSRGRNVLTGIIVGMLVFGVTYIISVTIARRGGGQTRQSLYAAGQIAQLTFLMTYRAFGRLIQG